MLDVSVKTLDGTNRAYSLQDAITVKEFKEKIAESISIVPDRQRLIFQGRVLQDEKKLSEYNVSGKVIHVVERPPPDMRRPSANTGSSGTDRGRRQGQSAPPGGGMSIGAFGLPDMVDPNHIQNLVQQTLSGMGDLGRNARVTSRTSSDGSAVDVHINLTRNGVTVSSESQQRIMHAHRLLAHVKHTLDQLENPGSSPTTDAPHYEANGTAPVNPDLATPISMSADLSPTTTSSTTSSTSPGSVAEATASSISTQATQTGTERGTQGTQTGQKTGTQSTQTGTQKTPIGTQTTAGAQTGTQTNWHRMETSTQGTQISTQDSSPMETSSQSTQMSTQSMETGTQSTHSSTQSLETSPSSADTSLPSSQTSCQGTQTGSRQSTQSTQSTSTSTASSGSGQTASTSTSTSGSTSTSTSGSTSTSTSGSTSTSTSGRTSTSGNSQPASRNEEHPETEKLGELMDELKDVERRLQPFRDQYHRLVVEDPALDEQTRADSQRIYNYVSSCLHHLAHVYHHISDLMVDFTTSRPRRLRAAANPPPAPTAVIHQTIPVQAQLSLISARPIRSARSRSRGRGANRTSNQTSQVTANIPLSSAPPVTGTTTSGTTASGTTASTTPGTTSASTTSTGTSTNSTSSTTSGGIPPGGFGFPFGVGQSPSPMMFMEVGPNSLSVNSISTHVVREGEESPHDVPTFGQPPQFAFGGPPQRPGAPADLMSNLMRMAQQASQRMTGPRGPMPPPPPPSTTPAQPASSAATPPSGVQTPANGAPNGAGSAGGVPRVPPIVQMDNRSVDPFMVCNSRHYLPMRQHPQRQNGEAAVNEVVNSLISSLVQGGQLPSSTSTSTTTSTTTTPAANLGTSGSNTLAGLLSGNAGPAVGGVNFAESFRNILSQNQGGSFQPPPPGGDAENQMSDQMFLDMVSGITSNLGQMMAGQEQQQQTSLLDFLNSIDPTHNVAMGEGIISEFYVAVSRQLTFPDLIALFTGGAAPLQRLRPTLQTFVNERILLTEEPTEENVDRAIERLCEEENFHGSIVDICQQSNVTVEDDVDFPATLMALLTHQLRTVIHVIMNSTANDEEFAQRLFDQCRSSIHELVVLTRRCLTNGMDGVDQLVRNRVSSASMSVANPMIRTWLVNTSSMNLGTLTPHITVTERDVQHYIVTKRQSESMDVDSTPTATPPPEVETTPTLQEATPPAEMAEAAGVPSDSEESFEDAISSMDAIVGRTMSEGGLETEGAAVNGRDGPDWRAVVPQEWVPIIQRDGDIQQQQQQQQQGGRRAPFSEAYISGMPAKRRKVMLPENELVVPGANVPIHQTGIRPPTSVDSLQRDLAAQTGTVRVAYQEQERSREERRRVANTAGKKN